jgi:hypothetical protein
MVAGYRWWSWDGEHFLAIASRRYTASVPAHVNASPLFPGDPALIATFDLVDDALLDTEWHRR